MNDKMCKEMQMMKLKEEIVLIAKDNMNKLFDNELSNFQLKCENLLTMS